MITIETKVSIVTNLDPDLVSINSDKWELSDFTFSTESLICTKSSSTAVSMLIDSLCESRSRSKNAAQAVASGLDEIFVINF